MDDWIHARNNFPISADSAQFGMHLNLFLFYEIELSSSALESQLPWEHNFKVHR